MFHVQRLAKCREWTGLAESGYGYVRHFSHKAPPWRSVALSGAILAFLAGFSMSPYADDKECIDFYTVGESACEPAKQLERTPVQTPVLVPPAAAQSDDQKVDEFLENYGKPPREFVQFYMNPTPENAKKWVEAYGQIMQKTQNVSQMWTDAERLYGQPGHLPSAQRPAAAAATAVQPVPQLAAPASATPTAQASSLGNFGGLNGAAASRPTAGVVPQNQGLKLTYYFSQVCPFCARMTPELAVLTMNYSGKLEFTCVDVTPFSASVAPSPEYLRDKLACQWRLPQADELTREGVVQTPTLIIQQGQAAPLKLSGYMSQEQLKPYFSR